MNNTMHELLEHISEKKDRLDALRPLHTQALADLEAWYDVELTYTSNALLHTRI